MRKTLAASVGLFALLATSFIAPPAEAGGLDWVIGSAFRIGPAHINIVFRDLDHGHPNYFYRVAAPFRYERHHCTTRCFHDGDYYFHERGCPALNHHLSVHHHQSGVVIERYAPRYQGPRYQQPRSSQPRFDDRSHYDRHDGYRDGRRGHRDERFDRDRGRSQRRDGHRSSRHQHGRHQHSRSCDHRH